VLNVPDKRAFYERFGLPVIYEGEEYPDFIEFGPRHCISASRKRPL
jgi:hypothetical protein